MQSCLIVRPAVSADAHGGDQVVYRRLERHLADWFDIDVHALAPISRPRQALNVVWGAPPEAARYDGGANREALQRRLAERRYDVVLFAHEAAFPLSVVAPPDGPRKVFYSHNVHSLIGDTDRSALGQVLRRGARAFDRRWFSQPDVSVVCISQADVAGLRRLGVQRDDIVVAPPGAPPAAPLPADAKVLPELLLTGSYGWWRKRRDLARFAEEPPLPYPILASDPLVLGMLKGRATPVSPETIDWSAGLRFALLTDRFEGGFKLKSLEYIALNAMLIGYCDLSAEFAGLPHAEEFVRRVHSTAEVEQLVSSMLAEPAEAVTARFQAFKVACLEQYQWERCLQPLVAALMGPEAEASPEHRLAG